MTIQPEHFEYTQLITVGILFAFAIREFFAWMKSRNEHKENQIYRNGGGYKEDIRDINNKLSNHLTDVNKEIAEIKFSIKLINDKILYFLIDKTSGRNNQNDKTAKKD